MILTPSGQMGLAEWHLDDWPDSLNLLSCFEQHATSLHTAMIRAVINKGASRLQACIRCKFDVSRTRPATSEQCRMDLKDTPSCSTHVESSGTEIWCYWPTTVPYIP